MDNNRLYRTSSELKAFARDRLLGHYGTLIGAYLLVRILSRVVTIPIKMMAPAHFNDIRTELYWDAIAEIPATIVLAILLCGYMALILRILRQQGGAIGDIYYCFQNHPLKIIKIILWMLIYLFPSYIPLFAGIMAYTVIPAKTLGIALFGIGLSAMLVIAICLLLSMSLSYYIYIDHPELPARECIRGSISLMKGNRFRLFYLGVSFLGLILLGILSLGLAFLWIAPYQYATHALFYEDIMSREAPPQNYENYEGEPEFSEYAADEKAEDRNYWM